MGGDNEENHRCINFVVNVDVFKELIETNVCYGFYDGRPVLINDNMYNTTRWIDKLQCVELDS